MLVANNHQATSKSSLGHDLCITRHKDDPCIVINFNGAEIKERQNMLWGRRISLGRWQSVTCLTITCFHHSQHFLFHAADHRCTLKFQLSSILSCVGSDRRRGIRPACICIYFKARSKRRCRGWGPLKQLRQRCIRLSHYFRLSTPFYRVQVRALKRNETI